MIIVVSGIPGAGKSTVSPLLAGTFERGVHVEADVVHSMIVSGGRWPNEEPLEEGARQLRLRGRNSCLLARSYDAAGFDVVIDDIVIGERFDEYADDLEGLQPDVGVGGLDGGAALEPARVELGALGWHQGRPGQLGQQGHLDAATGEGEDQ